MTRYLVDYWVNANTRDKYFDGFTAGRDRIACAATFDIDADDPEAAAEIAFGRANRYGPPTPEIDATEAPSMSVGDVVAVYRPNDFKNAVWLEVKGAGFARITDPHEAEGDYVNVYVIYNMTVRELLDGTGDARLARERIELRARLKARINGGNA